MAHQEHQECAKACFFQRPTGRRFLPVRQGIFPDRGGGITSADLARFYTSFRDREPERWGRKTAVGFPAIGGSPERQPLKELKSSVYLILAGPFRRSPPPQRPGTDASPWACLPIMPVPRTAGSAIRHTVLDAREAPATGILIAKDAESIGYAGHRCGYRYRDEPFTIDSSATQASEKL